LFEKDAFFPFHFDYVNLWNKKPIDSNSKENFEKSDSSLVKIKENHNHTNQATSNV